MGTSCLLFFKVNQFLFLYAGVVFRTEWRGNVLERERN